MDPANAEPLQPAATPSETAPQAPEQVSMLGRDEPPPAPEPEPQPEPEPEVPSLSSDEIASLQEQAGFYKLIQDDPEASQAVMDVFNKRRSTDTQPQQRQQNAPSEDPNVARIDYLEQQVAQYHQDMQLMGLMFREPELQQADNRKEFVDLINEYGVKSLDKAVDLWRKTRESRPGSQSQATPRLAATEGGHQGGRSQTPSSAQWDQRIASAKSTDDQVKAAINAVLEERGQM